MSRSRKKVPVTGHTTHESEKQDKRKSNRRLRTAVKQQINKQDEKPLPELREVSDVWGFAKDGKTWLQDPESAERIRRK